MAMETEKTRANRGRGLWLCEFKVELRAAVSPCCRRSGDERRRGNGTLEREAARGPEGAARGNGEVEVEVERREKERDRERGEETGKQDNGGQEAREQEKRKREKKERGKRREEREREKEKEPKKKKKIKKTGKVSTFYMRKVM